MALNSTPKVMASVAVAAVLALSLIAVAITYFPAQFAAQKNATVTGNSSSSLTSSSISSPTIPATSSNDVSPSVGLVSSTIIGSSSSGMSSSSEATILSTSTSFEIAISLCHGNCTLNYLPWSTYQTLNALTAASLYVVVANVTSALTLSRGGVPVSYYNITVITTLYPTSVSISSGYALSVSQIGGRANGTTMNLRGYPYLTKGVTYVFFLSFPSYLVNYYQEPNSNLSTLTTTGGPQGLFYIQAGKVFSLDNMYPQDDVWLPLKVEGVPLAQFIAEVQSA